jgi:AcrR family transcriptional regulator
LEDEKASQLDAADILLRSDHCGFTFLTTEKLIRMQREEGKLNISNRWGQGARLHDPERAKSMLLDAALYCLTNKGIQETTMQDIAKTARVSRRTVYRYFASKQDMLRQMVAYREKKAFQAVQSSTTPYADNFFLYFEEVVVVAVRHFQDIESTRSACIACNHDQSQPQPQHYSDNERLVDRWRRLLRAAYQAHVAKHPDIPNNEMLDKFASLAALFTTGHCQLRSTDESVRESFRNMISFATRLTLYPHLAP